MAKIDYEQLANYGSDELLEQCMSLAKKHPTWDWSLTPAAKSNIVAAHERIWEFLQEKAAFMKLMHAMKGVPFMERWSKRGAETPVTSDHTIVSNRFRLLDKNQENQIFILRVTTWNMMNKAHSKASCLIKDPITGVGAYANTPEEDLDEVAHDYIRRKRLQIKRIAHQIKSTPPTDAFLLQEVDFLTNSRFKFLKKEFENAMTNLGFYVCLSPMEPKAKGQAIVYNTKTLSVDNNYPAMTSVPGTSVGGQDERNTLFEMNFIHRDSKQKICIISVHLDFNADYSTKLLDISKAKSEQGFTVIWGGDTNHPPGHKIQGLTGDCEHATNYDATPDGMTVKHPGTPKAKTYDGFGFCPPFDMIMQSKVEKGKRFYINENTGQVEIRKYTPTPNVYTTFIGHPWVPREIMVLDLLNYRNKFLAALEGKIQNTMVLRSRIETAENIKVIKEGLEQGGDCPNLQKLMLKTEALLDDDNQLQELVKNNSYEKEQVVVKAKPSLARKGLFVKLNPADLEKLTGLKFV